MVPPGKIGAGTVRAFLKDLFSGPDREISPVCLNNNFGMGPTNHVSDANRDPPQEGQFLGVVRPIQKHWQSLLRSSLQNR